MGIAQEDSGVIARMEIWADEMQRLRSEVTRLDRDLVAMRLELAGVKVRMMVAAFALGMIPSILTIILKVMK